MRALLQRVEEASVSIGGTETATIGLGLAILLGVSREDTEHDSQYLVNKILNLRLFPGDSSHFHRSALEIRADILVVSQFTLYADCRKGRRPDFTAAAPPEDADLLYEFTVKVFRESGLKIATGQFRELMKVTIHNDGPVTLLLDSVDRLKSRRS